LDGAFDGTGFHVGLTGAEAGHQRDEKGKQGLAVHTNQRFIEDKDKHFAGIASIRVDVSPDSAQSETSAMWLTFKAL
jgi:hypothetical protein